MNNLNEYKIEEIFDQCLDAVLSEKLSISQCLEKYPDQAEELESLLNTALGIAHSPEIEPPAGARMRVRYALNQKMAEMDRPRGSFFQRLGLANGVITLLLVFSLGAGGLSYVASGSMPGQTLYPLKIGLENTLVSLTFTDEAKITLYAALNDRRIEEIQYLAEAGDSLGIVEITGRLQDNFMAAAALKGNPEEDHTGILSTPPPAGTVGTTAIPGDDRNNLEALDSKLLDYQESQLNSLFEIPPDTSPAVREAVSQAAAVIRAGYDSLIYQSD